MTAYNIKRFLLDIIYPNKCPFCNETIAHNEYYCCLGKLELLKQNDDNIALFEYNEKSSPFVYSIKDGGNGYAISAAAKLIYERLRVEALDLIVCVPTDSKRMRERGYNPPALIAAELSAMTGIPFNSKLLIKTRRTEVQKSLTAIQRRENVKGAFVCNSSCKGKILLVDDVRTTGATLDEVSRVLIESGAEQVITAVIATTV